MVHVDDSPLAASFASACRWTLGRWVALKSNFYKILTGSRGGIKIMPCGAQFMSSEKLQSREAPIPF